jgi:hypothetical protein
MHFLGFYLTLIALPLAILVLAVLLYAHTGKAARNGP